MRSALNSKHLEARRNWNLLRFFSTSQGLGGLCVPFLICRPSKLQRGLGQLTLSSEIRILDNWHTRDGTGAGENKNKKQRRRKGCCSHLWLPLARSRFELQPRHCAEMLASPFASWEWFHFTEDTNMSSFSPLSRKSRRGELAWWRGAVPFEDNGVGFLRGRANARIENPKHRYLL
jgi:hypothetical protein